ncbi:MAG: PEP-CTERM sorting domain-containing protein [Phycisphaerae bacterium]|nr:PEP-CTERM sorting domain-containing protein [Phycisphaerae bacterium]
MTDANLYTTPEPASLTMLTLGALTTIRRRPNQTHHIGS